MVREQVSGGIRALREDDVPAVMDVWLRATVQGHPFLSREFWLSHLDEVRDRWLPAAETTVLEADGKVMGFLSVLEGGWIGALFVDPQRQGRGFGGALVRDAQRRYPRLGLEVYRENAAVRFYERCGFLHTEERADEETGHPLCAMEWKI